MGKLQFFDLASAEKVGDEKIGTDQLADTLYINKSISALSKSECIVPFLTPF